MRALDTPLPAEIGEWLDELARSTAPALVACGSGNPSHVAMCEANADATLAYLLRGAYRTAGKKWLGGVRQTPLPAVPPGLPWRLFAEREIYGVPAHVAAGLVAWRTGLWDLRLRRTMATDTEILTGQAAGYRWVSLLPDNAPCAPQKSPFYFALHDICHASHYFDPMHHHGQVGFFADLVAAMATNCWSLLTADFADDWPRDLARVTADMNGSALFLFSALRRKVHLAAVQAGLDPDCAKAMLFEALGMHGETAEAARLFSVHKAADPAFSRYNAAILLAWWQRPTRAPELTSGRRGNGNFA